SERKQNNSENEKSLQALYENYKKFPINHAINNARNIFGTRSFIFGYCLVHDHLDLDSQI
uniref:hypothetical protein n=1 Tax=Staphylococcus aureus TaxID=1280 RepID=UPI0038B2772A